MIKDIVEQYAIYDGEPNLQPLGIPAVGFFNEEAFDQEILQEIKQTSVPPEIPCVIIAGEHDKVIPMSNIEAMATRSSDQNLITFKKVNDDHSLNKYPGLLLKCIDKMIAGDAIDSQKFNFKAQPQ